MRHPSWHWTSGTENFSGRLHMTKAPLSFSPGGKSCTHLLQSDSSVINLDVPPANHSQTQTVRSHLSICAFKIGCRVSREGVVRPPLVSLPSLPPLLSDLTTGESVRVRETLTLKNSSELPVHSAPAPCRACRGMWVCVRGRVCVCVCVVWAWQKRDPSTEDVLRLWGSVYRHSDCRLMRSTCLLACVLTERTCLNVCVWFICSWDASWLPSIQHDRCYITSRHKGVTFLGVFIV